MNKHKPMEKKAYGSIPHFHGSRRGPGDRGVSEKATKLFTESFKSRPYQIVVQEKVDGSNVAVYKDKHGTIIPLGRSGYRAVSSNYSQHRFFHKWVKLKENRDKFDKMLKPLERVCGEWLLQAHGTRYNINKDNVFVAFDIFNADNERYTYTEAKKKCEDCQILYVNTVHVGKPMSVEKALELVGKGKHGALEEVEGVVYRLENVNTNKVLQLAKFVKHNKVDGKYFKLEEEQCWNISPGLLFE